MPTSNSSVISIRIRNSDLEKLKAESQSKAPGAYLLNLWKHPRVELSTLDTSEFEKVCKRKGQDAQSILNSVTDQLYNL
jgi:hypothetical protein